MKTTWCRTLLALALLGTASAAALAAGGSSAPTPDPEPIETPEQMAAVRYNEGLALRDTAAKMKKKLSSPETPEAKHEKIQRKIDSTYERAIKEFTAAIGFNPDFYQAYSSLAYVYRMIGDYATALEAYDRALELNPDYVEAIEYRGEAYLGLNRINDAQNAYRALLGKNTKLAADLLGAMRAWIEQRRNEPAGIDVASLDGLEDWVDEREMNSAQTSSQRKAWTW